MPCSGIRKKLIFLLDHELNREEEQEIRNHIRECKECSQSYELLKAAYTGIQDLKVNNPDPYLIARTEERIYNLSGNDLPKQAAAFRLKPLLLAAAVFTLLIAASVAVLNLSSAGKTENGSDALIMVAGQYQMGNESQDIMESYYLTEE